MKNTKGITLIALIITIIVLLILASIGTYSGINVINSSKLTAFTTQLKIMQTQINAIYQENKEQELGEEITGDVQTQADIVFAELKKDSNSGITSQEGYRYWNQSLVQELGIEGVEQDFFVNLEKRSIVSYEGLKYQGKTYYTLSQVPNGLYNVEYIEPTAEKPTFQIETECVSMGKWETKISNIQYDGYIDKWQVKYQLKGNDYWNTTQNLNFQLDEGKYIFKIQNGNVESETVEKDIGYVKDGLVLYYDGIVNTRNGNNPEATSWEDLSGNKNDTIMYNMNSETGYYEENGYVFKENSSYMELSKEFPMNAEQGNTIEVVCNAYKGNPYSGQTAMWFGTTQAINGTCIAVAIRSDVYNSAYISRLNALYPPPNNNLIEQEKNLLLTFTIPIECYQTQTTSQTIAPNVYKNGKILYKLNPISQAASAVQNKKTEIGRAWQYNGENRTFYGKIYAIRAYNRQLTEQEIQLNYEIDKDRFNIE